MTPNKFLKICITISTIILIYLAFSTPLKSLWWLLAIIAGLTFVKSYFIYIPSSDPADLVRGKNLKDVYINMAGGIGSGCGAELSVLLHRLIATVIALLAIIGFIFNLS